METKCLIKKCEKDKSTRGLCYGCYNQARLWVKKGKTTEEELIGKGMMMAKRVKGFSFFSEQFYG